jgi:hypothetical protein
MTNTKWLSALLAGTALVAASTAAMAETSLVTMTRNAAGEGVTFSIAPTADMPAGATEISISGELRALGSAYNGTAGDGYDGETESDYSTRARVVVKGSTETSVGTVGAYVRFQSTNGGDVTASKQYGYWQATPEWQILAGRTDSIGAIEAGVDWNLNASLFNYYAGPTNDTENQVRATYTTGPLSWAVAVEDTDPGSYTDSEGQDLAFGTQVKYSAGSGIDVALNGIMQDDGSYNSDYFIGAGLNTSFNSIGVTVAVGTGEGYEDALYSSLNADEGFTVASMGLTFGVSEATSVEVGMLYTDTEDQGSWSDINAAVLWSPAKQLTLGAGVGYSDFEGDDENETSAGIGAWFKF